MRIESGEIKWTVFPMKEHLGKAILFWVVLVFTVWAVSWNLQNVLMTLVATLVLLGALTSFYLPTTYSANADGVSWKRLTGGKKLEWTRVRSVVDEREGLFLSPYPVKSRMENFRGIYLPYRRNREELLAVVKYYVPGVKGMPKDAFTADEADEAENIQSVDVDAPKGRNYFGHRRD